MSSWQQQCADALRTTSNDMVSQLDSLRSQQSVRLQSLQQRQLEKLSSRTWLRTSLIGLFLVVGLGVGSWGIVASLLRFAEALSRHAYLEQRGLSPATLTDPRFKSTVLTDPRGAAVFPHYDQLGVCGYEIKHTGITGFAKGGQKGIWYTSNIDTAPRIVVVESAIDGLSHAQIQGDPDTAYLSTAGSLSDAQIELFRTAFLRATQRGATIVLATDADPAGDELATKLHALAPPGVVVLRERPSAKDWNDLLQQRVRDYSRPRRGLS